MNEAFRPTQKSADTAIEFEFVGLPRYAARHNMEFVVAGIKAALRTMSGRNVAPAKVAFAHNRNSTCGKASRRQIAHGAQGASDRNRGRHDGTGPGAARGVDRVTGCRVSTQKATPPSCRTDWCSRCAARRALDAALGHIVRQHRRNRPSPISAVFGAGVGCCRRRASAKGAQKPSAQAPRPAPSPLG